MTINTMDAREIAQLVADGFRTRVAHHRENLTSDEYQRVLDLCLEILTSRVDNKNVQYKTIDPITNEVTDHVGE